MNICKMVTLSTAHVSPRTAGKLSDPLFDLFPLAIAPVEYGWMVYIPSGYIRGDNIPDDLDKCVRLAIENKCTYIRFDCDEPTTEILNVYNW